jgi:hypothetical protein
MDKEYPPLQELKRLYGRNKRIPPRYELQTLKALSHYPELSETRIDVIPVKFNPVPYQTTPVLWSLLTGKPRFRITLREEAEPPVEQALFRHLPELAQVATIGHELGHVLQYTGREIRAIIRKLFSSQRPSLRRVMERGADIAAIEHGLGFELYTHAVYIRSIKGYVEERKELDILYLHPNEILEMLPPDQLHAVPSHH